MKVEYKYAVQPGTDDTSVRRRTVAVFYFYTGERVEPGRYVCTFCGHETMAAAARTLPPCHACDSPEFAWEAAA